MKNVIMIITLCLAGTLLLTACNVSGSNTKATTGETTIATEESTTDTLATTETAVTTETTVTPTPTVKPTVNPTVTPTTVPETSSTTVAATTAAPTPKPTTPSQTTTPTQTTAPAATTAAPPPTTAAPTEPAPTTTKSTTPAYTENPDVIRDGIIQYAKDNGVWYPDGEVIGDDEKSYSLGYHNSDQKYIEAYKFKILPNGEKWYGIVSVSCRIENGWIYISSEKCRLPES